MSDHVGSEVAAWAYWTGDFFDDGCQTTFDMLGVYRHTAAEVEALVSLLNLPAGARILDVPCGFGRHAGPLQQRGYRVTGVDNSSTQLDDARARHPDVDFVLADMRTPPPRPHDAVLNLWTSFGSIARSHIAAGRSRNISGTNDVDHLEQLPAESNPAWRRTVVIESAYSMDAGIVPIPGIRRFRLHHHATITQGLFRQRRIPMASTESPNVTARVSDPHKCKQISDVVLYGHARYARPIKYPSVPRGAERLRITPSPLHSPSATRRFVEHIDMACTGFALRRAPDFAFDSRSAFAAGAIGRAVSG